MRDNGSLVRWLIMTVTKCPSLSFSAGCGLKRELRWSWRPLWVLVGSATPPWPPSTRARWNLLCWGALSVRPAFTSSSGGGAVVWACFTVAIKSKGTFQSRLNDGVHLFDFLFRELSVGRGSTATLGGGVMPKIHVVEPWDGKDGQVSH